MFNNLVIDNWAIYETLLCAVRMVVKHEQHNANRWSKRGRSKY